MKLATLSPREASIFACVCDTVVAPEPLLPPVRETDAVQFLDRWLAAAPRLNRIGLRALLYAAGARSARARRPAQAARAERARARGHAREARAARGELRDLVEAGGGHRLPRLLRRRRDHAAARLRRRTRTSSGRAGCGPRRGARERPPPAAAYTDGSGMFVPEVERVERGSRIGGERLLRADVCVIGTGAGGAPVAKELAEGGMRVVMLEEGERRTTDEFTRPPARHDRAPLPRRRPARHGRQRADRAAARLARGRHHGRQLGHLLPDAAAGAGGVGRAVRARGADSGRSWTPTSGASSASST